MVNAKREIKNIWCKSSRFGSDDKAKTLVGSCVVSFLLVWSEFKNWWAGAFRYAVF